MNGNRGSGHLWTPNVRARVFPLNELPPISEPLLLDTMVFGWLFDPVPTLQKTTRATTRAVEIDSYVRFVERFLAATGKIAHSTMCYLELRRVVEHNELTSRFGRHVSAGDRKEMLHSGQEVAGAMRQRARRVWREVERLSRIRVRLPASRAAEAEVIGLVDEYGLDPADACTVVGMRKAGIVAILTDDVDFVCADGLAVYTANEHALAGKALPRGEP
jgi:predicted nucleic acid-binding protein